MVAAWIGNGLVMPSARSAATSDGGTPRPAKSPVCSRTTGGDSPARCVRGDPAGPSRAGPGARPAPADPNARNAEVEPGGRNAGVGPGGRSAWAGPDARSAPAGPARAARRRGARWGRSARSGRSSRNRGSRVARLSPVSGALLVYPRLLLSRADRLGHSARSGRVCGLPGRTGVTLVSGGLRGAATGDSARRWRAGRSSVRLRARRRGGVGCGHGLARSADDQRFLAVPSPRTDFEGISSHFLSAHGGLSFRHASART